MALSNAGKKLDNIVLELLSDNQLSEIQKSSDLLFSGKIAMKNEGGFKKLYDLPSPALIERCSASYECITDVLSIRIKHYGWLCHRVSGWTQNVCILFAEHGLLFVYIKPNKGYVLKSSFCLKLAIFGERLVVLPRRNSPNNYFVKMDFAFGSISFNLSYSQAKKWRLPLLNAFDDVLPCFTTAKKPKKDKQDPKVQQFESITLLESTNGSAVKLDFTPASSNVTISEMGICSTFSCYSSNPSIWSCDDTKLDKDYKVIKSCLATPFKITSYDNLQTDPVHISEEKNTKPIDTDSAFGSAEELEKWVEEFSLTSSVRQPIENSHTHDGRQIPSIDSTKEINLLSTEGCHMALKKPEEAVCAPKPKYRQSLKLAEPIYGATSIYKTSFTNMTKSNSNDNRMVLNPKTKVTDRIRFFENMSIANVEIA